MVECESPFFQNLDGRNSGHALQKSLFLCDYWTKSDGVFAEMEIISYSFIIQRHTCKFSIYNQLNPSITHLCMMFCSNGSSSLPKTSSHSQPLSHTLSQQLNTSHLQGLRYPCLLTPLLPGVRDPGMKRMLLKAHAPQP